MTFSIAAICPETAMFGMAITTSSLAVGSRCCHARAGIGAALTQHRTDPRLGPLILDHLAEGLSAQEAVDRAAASTVDAGWRQLAAVDKDGGTGFFHGRRIYSIHGEAVSQGVVAVANIIVNPGVPAAMVAAFEAVAGQPFPERLIAALDGGLAAGGEMVPVRSAALYVVRDQPFPYADLRVDASEAPIGALADLWRAYAGQAEAFVTKVLDPDSVPPDPELEALTAARP
ncbi:MAG: DUF1028 domain-containing protein [Alphaproteobacteria bacterium]|jgi:uncharacterized Ntn-hydrolase superfamily protein|nr:DUF1028 domain-containing protein [Alphaproteobacteria bacterium]